MSDMRDSWLTKLMAVISSVVHIKSPREHARFAERRNLKI